MKNHFTLIELLIVVAIIAILAALLLPALNKARERAMAIKCTSQLKTTGASLLLYANDYKGVIPAPNSRGLIGQTSGEYPWSIYVLSKYVKFPIEDYLGVSQGYRKLFGKYPFGCPGSGLREPERWSMIGYGLRCYLRNPTAAFKLGGRILSYECQPGTANDGMLKASWKEVSKMVLAGDSAEITATPGLPRTEYYTLDDTTSGSPTGAFIERHGGRGNVCFGDGHVEAITGRGLIKDEARRNATNWIYYSKDGMPRP